VLIHHYFKENSPYEDSVGLLRDSELEVCVGVLRDAKSSMPWGNWFSLEVLVCFVGYTMVKKTE